MEDPRIISALFIFLKMAYYNVLINKKVIYFKEIVEMIAEKQGISFENRTTHTWYEPTIETYEDKLIALFKPEVEKDAE